MKPLWPIAAVLMVIPTGCELTQHHTDVLHQQILGLGGWSNYDTRGWLIGIGHVTRVTDRWTNGSSPVPARGTQIDLICVTNSATQMTILIAPGPVVVSRP